jgi:small subunit ribosomal protein S8
MVNDPIANLLTTIRNAGAARHATITVPHSRLKKSALEVMRKTGFIKSVSETGTAPKRSLEVELAYDNSGTPKIAGAKRVSKFSCRVYSNAKDFKPVKRGLGIAVVTTPKGVMTSDDAQKQGIGGEVMFEIW